jgi:transposase
LTDAQWQRLKPLLPPERPRTGRPNHNHRTILNGILWVLRTGAPWRDLPERYGPVGTVSSRFYRWRAVGLWDRVLAVLQSQAEERNEVDWSLHFVDATIVRAHQHAAGARRPFDTLRRRCRGVRARRWGARKEASRPSCTCAPRATAARSRRC